MIHPSNIQVTINQAWQINAIEVWVIELRGSKQYNVNQIDGQLSFVEIDEMQPLMRDKELKPFLTLPRIFGAILFQNIAEYNEKNGRPTQDHNLLLGQLEAVERHLGDLREYFGLALGAIIKEK